MQDSLTTTAPQRALSSRVLSIDVLRGLTIALMILVNDPGDWSHVYAQLDHSPWNGFTLTDFVFPNFLFLVGVSIVFSFASRSAKGNCRLTLTGHIFRRAAILFAIDLFLTAFPSFHLTHLRLYGVLTRIALCYLAAGLIYLAVWKTCRPARALVAITAVLLLGYWALMRFVPVPGLGFASLKDAIPTHAIPILDPDRNLAAWLDRAINAFIQAHLHTGSLYNQTRDPEGLLSTLPAIATTLIGCVTGLWLRRADTTNLATKSRHSERSSESPYLDSVTKITRTCCLNGLIAAGLISLTAGLLWNLIFPINKNLWTSSYVLFSSGLSLLLLALFYWLIDIHRLYEKPTGRALLTPWLVFGSNAIAAYILSELIVEIMLWIQIPAAHLADPANPAKPITAWLWSYLHLFARHGSTDITSATFALAFTVLCLLPNWLLWRTKIFLRI